MTKLTPRQIEVLTEEFDGSSPVWGKMTPAQRTGRVRVLDSMRSYGPHALIDARSKQITARGLAALEPHYADKPKIAAAIEARRNYEAELAETLRKEAQDLADQNARRIERRKAKLIEGYRRILADHHFDLKGMPDELILEAGNQLASFEGTV